MPDEKMADGTNPLDAIAQAIEEPGGLATESKVADPAPAQVEAPAQSAEKVEEPPVTAAQPAPVKPEDQTVKILQMVLEQNRQLSQGTQEALSQSRALAEKLLKAEQPQMSPEQRKERIDKAFKELNTDPDSYLERRIEGTLAAKMKELESRFAPRDARQETSRIAQDHLARIYSAPDGTVLRPEIGDPAFWQGMISKENQEAVVGKYYKGKSNQEIINDPSFYTDLYHEYKSSVATKAAASSKTPSPTQSDADAQRAVIAGHGQPAGAGAGKTPAPAPKLDPDAEFKKNLLEAGNGNLNDLLAKADWKARR